MNGNLFMQMKTTGLDPHYDEVVQLSIVNSYGNEVFNEILRPRYLRRWPHSQSYHGITEADVIGKKMLEDCSSKLLDICLNKEVIIYNKDFLFPFIKNIFTVDVNTTFECSKNRFLYYCDFKNIVENRLTAIQRASSICGHYLDNTYDALAEARASRKIWDFCQKSIH